MASKAHLTAASRSKAPTKSRSSDSSGIERNEKATITSKSPVDHNPSCSTTESRTTPPAKLSSPAMPSSSDKHPGSSTTTKPSTSTSTSTSAKTSRQRPDLSRPTASTSSRLVHTKPTASRLASTGTSASRAQKVEPRATSVKSSRGSAIHTTSKSSDKELVVPKRTPRDAPVASGSTSQNPLRRSDHVAGTLPASSSLQESKQQAAPPKSSSSTTNQFSLQDSRNKVTIQGQLAGSVSKPQSVPAPSSLQTAAQLYPWMYMTSSLEVAMSKAEVNNKAALDAKERELVEQEADLADLRIRFDVERVLALYDELTRPELSSVLPVLLDGFLQHGVRAAELTDGALHLASLDPKQVDLGSPVVAYNQTLNSLTEAIRQAEYLTSSFSTLLDEYDTSSSLGDSNDQPLNPRTRISAAFGALLSVLQARCANLTLAREVVLASKENVGVYLKKEGLRVTVDFFMILYVS